MLLDAFRLSLGAIAELRQPFRAEAKACQPSVVTIMSLESSRLCRWPKLVASASARSPGSPKMFWLKLSLERPIAVDQSVEIAWKSAETSL